MNQWIILVTGIIYVFLIVLFIFMLIRQLLSISGSTRLVRLYGKGGKRGRSWKGVIVFAGLLIVYSVVYWVIL